MGQHSWGLKLVIVSTNWIPIGANHGSSHESVSGEYNGGESVPDSWVYPIYIYINNNNIMENKNMWNHQPGFYTRWSYLYNPGPLQTSRVQAQGSPQLSSPTLFFHVHLPVGSDAKPGSWRSNQSFWRTTDAFQQFLGHRNWIQSDSIRLRLWNY